MPENGESRGEPRGEPNGETGWGLIKKACIAILVRDYLHVPAEEGVENYGLHGAVIMPAVSAKNPTPESPYEGIYRIDMKLDGGIPIGNMADLVHNISELSQLDGGILVSPDGTAILAAGAGIDNEMGSLLREERMTYPEIVRHYAEDEGCASEPGKHREMTIRSPDGEIRKTVKKLPGMRFDAAIWTALAGVPLGMGSKVYLLSQTARNGGGTFMQLGKAGLEEKAGFGIMEGLPEGLYLPPKEENRVLLSEIFGFDGDDDGVYCKSRHVLNYEEFA